MLLVCQALDFERLRRFRMMCQYGGCAPWSISQQWGGIPRGLVVIDVVGSVAALGVIVVWRNGVLLVSRWVLSISVGGGEGMF